ncbi:MAG: response regulator [Desulfobacterales bacterium]|nr:response regulator [Desulfobacterales bacterium]MCP4159533.1 response regulator [Deltaproteobacteria bacterium]
MSEIKNTTLLFVDDEESILEIADEYFRYKGYNVITANDGTVAVEVLKNNKVDLCFTDINMPEMGGVELTQHIRAHYKNIPVIVMTGFPSLDNSIKILKNGVVDFLIKPVNLEQMEFCIKRVLREHKLYVENLILTREVEDKKRIEALNRELTIKVDELNTLNKIMSGYSSIRTSAELFNSAVSMCTEILKANESGFYFYNEGMDIPYEIVLKSDENVDKFEKNLINELIIEIVKDKTPFLVKDSKNLKKDAGKIKSIIIVPLKIRGRAFGAITAVSRDISFTEKDIYYLSFLTENAAKTIENIALYENIYENLFATLSAFVAAVEVRDSYTHSHSNRVACLAVELAKNLNCTKGEINVIDVAGRLHDIGKIGIRDDILLKPDVLTKEEFEKVKEHPAIGSTIVSQLGLLNEEGIIIKHHHERFDGKGYPDGLSGENIPYLSRILTVADSFDAIASDRPYRKKLPFPKAIDIVKKNSGSQFDPDIVNELLKMSEDNILKILNSESIEKA